MRKSFWITIVLVSVLTSVTNGAVVTLYTKNNPPLTPVLADLPLLTSIVQHGITWTFGEPVRVGQFVNGDYYVIDNDDTDGVPVTVVVIDPSPADGRNGSVLNLPSTHNRSGFDSRVSANRYDASLRANPPIQMQPGDSLVSTISVNVIGTIKRVLRSWQDTISPVRTASVLTCLASPVPPDAFRPSYSDTSNLIYLSRNLERGYLPQLAKVTNTPQLSEFEGYFQRPWIDTLFFGFDAPIEYMPDYGREVGRAVGIASLLLTLNFTPEEKEPLLVYLVQYGIDLYGTVRAGHRGWPAHGGHGAGRKAPIILAGVLLQDAGMQQPIANFSEDMQTMYATDGPNPKVGWTGASALYAGHVGPSGNSVKPGWGPYEHLQPRDWVDMIGEDYRRCCTSVAWVGQALTARLIQADQAWGHPAFFDYVDRWMTVDDSVYVDIIQQQTGVSFHASWQQQGQAWDAFVDEMWAAYRSSSPPSAPTGLRTSKQDP